MYLSKNIDKNVRSDLFPISYPSKKCEWFRYHFIQDKTTLCLFKVKRLKGQILRGCENGHE